MLLTRSPESGPSVTPRGSFRRSLRGCMAPAIRHCPDVGCRAGTGSSEGLLPSPLRSIGSTPLRTFDGRRTSPVMLTQIKSWATSLKRDVVALWIAAQSPRTPMAAKLVAGAVAAYALSPIDLIPDFIPVLGYLDDLVIVPLGIALAVRLIPAVLMAEFRVEAAAVAKPVNRPMAVAIVVLWLVMSVIVAVWCWRKVR